MSISFPTFIDKEIPSPEKFNAFVQALQAKFNAGFTSAEIQWPLVAGGNLVMGQYEITGARKIFNLVNANEYSSLQAAMTAAGSGGVVFIPPDTTISTGGVTLVGSNVAVIGAGPSSVIKYTAAPTGPMIQNDSGGESGFLIANLTLDGNSEAGTEKDGIYLKGATDIIIHNVWFQDISGDSIHLTNTGAAGASTERIVISDCHFSAGGEKHIFADDLKDAVISRCVFDDPDEEAIYLSPGGGTNFLARILISGNVIQNGDTTSIYVDGSGAAGAYHREIIIADNLINGQDADPGIVAGTTGNPLVDTIIHDNVVSGPPGDGIECCVEKGQVRGNQLYDAGADGIDVKASKYLIVSNNHCVSATNVGVRATSASTCVIHDNFLLDCNTALMRGADSRMYNNEGATGVPPSMAYATTDAQTITLPGNLLQVGDQVQVTACGAGDGTSAALRVIIDGNNFDVTEAITATGNRVGYIQGVVKDSTSIQFVASGHTDDRDVDVDRGSITGLDLTASITITYGMTAGASSRYGMFVTVYGGEIV